MGGPRAIERSVTAGGLRLHYREYPGAGTPEGTVVLLHGLASSSQIWGAVAPRLAERARVLAPDLRGHGRSDKPDSGYDFASIVADLDGLLDAAGVERPVLVGHSWGAHVALEYAAAHPERSAGLVLVDGGLEGLDGMTWEQVERDLAPPDLTHLTMPELIAQVKEWGWDAFWDEQVEATLLSLFDVAEDGTVRPRLSRANHMRILRAVWQQRLTDLYPAVDGPALIVPTLGAGEERRTKEEQVARARALLPAAAVRWFENTSHDVPLERPRELAAAIDSFLAGRREVQPWSKLQSMAR